MKNKLLLIITFNFLVYAAFSQNAELVKDINSIVDFSNQYGSFHPLNGTTMLFFADDEIHGVELWKSDGTEAGTTLVKDINVGSAGSRASAVITNSYYDVGKQMVNLNGFTYFYANDGINGEQLWRTDGSTSGTTMLKIGDLDAYPRFLTNIAGVLYFSAQSIVNYTSNGLELWRSDGTVAGTYMVKDLKPSGDSEPQDLTDVNGSLFFTANGNELWKSDGTTAGTVLIKDIDESNANFTLSELTSVNGLLFFINYNYSTFKTELWKSDGTSTGTTKVVNNNDIFEAKNLRKLNNTLVFSGFNGNSTLLNPNSTAWQIWKSDGTEAGTVMIKNIFTYTYNDTQVEGSNPENLSVNINNNIYFVATDGVNGFTYGLWKTDGTVAGTVVVKRFANNSAGTRPKQLTNVNGTLFFVYNELNISGTELWKSNGTQAGTLLVKDINLGNENGIDETNPGASTLLGLSSTLFFAADDGINGFQLWRSDGSIDGTGMVKKIINSTVSAEPHYLTNVNGTLFFTAKYLPQSGGYSEPGLWKSDGTANGTVLVKEGYSTNLTNVNGTLFLTRYNGSKYSLWKSDGTQVGTTEVKNLDMLRQTSYTNTDISYAFNFNGTLFFIAHNGDYDYELWKSDGTTAGTVVVKDINTGASGAFWGDDPYFFIFNNSLYFIAYTNNNGQEIWKTDGTTAGTVMLKDIWSGTGNVSSENPHFTILGSNLFFIANDGTEFRQLWKTDGTEAGTIRITNTNDHAQYYDLVISNNALFLSDISGNLWKSDGTAPNTILLKDGFNGTSRYLTNVNNTLFFFGASSSTGRELWKSDGTTAGTILVKDINTGGNSSVDDYGDTNIQPTSLNGKFYFVAKKPASGIELWQSDGTQQGTTTLEIFESNNSSLPHSLTTINSTLFFSAQNIKGQELWKVTLPPCPTSLFISTPNYTTENVIRQASATGGLITATNQVTNTAKIAYQSKAILLSTGFKAEPISGGYFKAEIGGCN